MTKTKGMNVLFIMTDQHRADHMSCAGNPVLKTPHMDKLASEGVRFTNAFVANPMCMPNRASLFTGVYPNVHGLRSNGINLPENIETFVETMRKRGYVTHKVGKPHLQFWVPPYKRKNTSAETIHAWLHEPDIADKNFPKPYYGFEKCEMTLGHGDACTGHYLSWLEERRPGAREWMQDHLSLNGVFSQIWFESDMPVEHYPTYYCQEKTINFCLVNKDKTMWKIRLRDKTKTKQKLF